MVQIIIIMLIIINSYTISQTLIEILIESACRMVQQPSLESEMDNVMISIMRVIIFNYLITKLGIIPRKRKTLSNIEILIEKLFQNRNIN